AGRPVVSPGDLCRLRFVGNRATRTLIVEHLLAQVIAEPVVRYVIQSVAILAIGSDARRICVPTPTTRYPRSILLNDRAVDDEELLSILGHEIAHSWLMPDPPSDVTAAEEIVYSGPCAADAVAVAGDLRWWLETGIRNEQQACRLAARWGAGGLSIDVA